MHLLSIYCVAQWSVGTVLYLRSTDRVYKCRQRQPCCRMQPVQVVYTHVPHQAVRLLQVNSGAMF